MKKSFIVVCSLVCSLLLDAQIINTIAGTSYLPSNTPAISAQLNSPTGVTVDANNNIYFSDAGFSIVRKISTAGLISTYAGNGTYGCAGDNGAALNANVSGPIGIVADQFGNKYFADSRCNVVKKVSATGIITTIAGTGVAGFGGDNGPATMALLNFPQGLEIDSVGNIYVADNKNNRIRKITPSGIITTVAGNGTSAFSGDGGQAVSASLKEPFGVRVKSGNIYIADTYNFRVRKVNSAGVIITICGGGLPFSSGDGGQAASASLIPVDVGFDSFFNIYITDFAGNKIRKINSSTNVITSIAGTGTAGYSGDGGLATSAKLNFPSGMFVQSNGTIVFCDTQNQRVRKIDVNGVITTIAGLSLNGSVYATNWRIGPSNVCLNRIDGSIYTSDFFGDMVLKVDLSNGLMKKIAGNGSGGFSGDGGLAINASMDSISGVFVDASGIYISDAGNARIRKVGNNGIITTIAGTGTNGYSGNGGLATSAKINQPQSLVVYNNNLYFADAANGRIRKIDLSTGIISNVAGNGTGAYSGDGGSALTAAIGICYGMDIDQAGNIYLAQNSHNVIRKISSAGIISTIAGNGNAGFSGDGGLATLAEFNDLRGIAVDDFGNVYVADADNNRVRKINNAGIISTYALNGTIPISGDGGSAILAGGAVSMIDVDANSNTLIIGDIYNNVLRMVSNVAVPDICLVSTDSLSENNLITWDKTNYFNVDSFIVYRETSSNPNVYSKIGAIPYSSLSEFTDTNRVWFTTNSLPNGNPQISTYRYKIKIRDNQNNFSTYCNYHNTVYLNDLQNGTFQWNTYNIEGTPSPVSAYNLYRDTTGTGDWQFIGTTTGSQTQLNDPNYFTYQNRALWRVDAEGFSCNPTMRYDNNGHNEINAAIVKSKSNIKNNRTVGIKDGRNQDVRLKVYPNPASDLLNVEVSLNNATQATIIIENMLGQVVYSQQTNKPINSINTSLFETGVYFVKVNTGKGVVVEKIIVE